MKPGKRQLAIAIAVPALASGIGIPVTAQQSAATTQVVFEIREINEISVSGDPEPLVVSRATAGSEPEPAIDDGTTWTLTTNATNKKVTALLDADMPTGVTLTVELSAPTGATSAGPVPLSASANTLVSGIGTVDAARLPLTYILSATTAAGVVPRDSRSVTFTIVAES